MTKYCRTAVVKVKIPMWRDERFSGLHGVMDSLFRKVAPKEATGAWFEKQKRKLEYFETACVSDLYRRAAPLQTALQESEQLLASLDTVKPERKTEGILPSTTEEARQTKARRSQEQEFLKEKEKAAHRYVKLKQELLNLIDETNFRIEEAYKKANVSIVKYAKACCFKPLLGTEIPRYSPEFQISEVRAIFQVNRERR